MSSDGDLVAGRGAVGSSPPRVVRHLAWFVVAAFSVYALPGYLRAGLPPWRSASDETQSLYWVVAYLTSALAVVLAGREHARWPVTIRRLGTALIPWVLVGAALFSRSDVPHSRVIALFSFTFGLALVAVPLVFPGRPGMASGAVALLMAALAGVASFRQPNVTPASASAGRQEGVISTGLLPLSVVRQTGLVRRPAIPGGALVAWNAGYLLVTGAADWFVLDWDATRTALVARALSVPRLPGRDVTVSDSSVRRPFARVTGLVVDTTDGSRRTLFVAHDAWNVREQCLTIRISSIAVDREGGIEAGATWRTVFQTTPCVALTGAFDPYEGGGRIALLPGGALLLTAGDFGLNQDRGQAIAQDPTAQYGKTVLVGADGTGRVFTTGHRNPQGVTTDLAGQLWLTEHGPHGGDEVNHLEEGANYGWPVVSYGTDYGGYLFNDRLPPLSQAPFTEPALAFVPSYALSSLITVRRPLFRSWQGDLLAGALAGTGIVRLRLRGSAVSYAEHIPLGIGVRDLAEGHDGRIAIWTDFGDVLWLAPAATETAGTEAFTSCARCHGAAGLGTPLGPNLVDLLGRRVASTSFSYSDALRRVGGRWTESRLQDFLRDPERFAPGTSMQGAGLPVDAERDAVMSYLRLMPAGPARRSRLPWGADARQP